MDPLDVIDVSGSLQLARYRTVIVPVMPREKCTDSFG